ncbi:MAG: hypothetical protein LBB78_04090 [Spirochaetaceae bacterium]|jgi:Na+-driven multidrug efflux pump|nr:hypothetical protein [Spirochaetaceae bacterium]
MGNRLCHVLPYHGLGSDPAAANAASAVVRNLAAITAGGLAGGGGIMLGNALGQSHFENAKRDAGRLCRTALVCGIAGGDSRFGLINDIFTMWVFAVPSGLLTAFVFRLPPMVVYFILFLDEFVKMPFIFRHYFKYGWLKNITRT